MMNRMKILAVGGILTLGTFACSADMVQNPSSTSQASYENYENTGDRPEAYADTGPYERSYEVTKESVQGELIQIDGDYYIVKDSLTGNEVRFRADEKAARLSRNGGLMAEQFQAGDWLEVQLSPEGDALLIQEARATFPTAEQPLP